MTTIDPSLQKMTSFPGQEEEISEVYAQGLTSFVPEIVKHALHRNDRLVVPYCKTFYSAALFADVSGFTAMSQALAAKGTRGTEELPQHINSYLGQIGKKYAHINFQRVICTQSNYERRNKKKKKKKKVKKIIAFGGDVVKFAGDALLCVWLPDPQVFEDMEKQEKELQQLTHLAAKCALDIQNEYGVMKLAGARITENQKRKNGQEDPALRVKLGIGAGKCSLLIVGGKLDRCEYLVCGDALMQAFKCE
ncbi:hypothetical protein RFI_17067, partial [Reticulomyxa filosa]